MPDSHISRRTLTKGAAWAAPVVAVSAAAPAMAASPVVTWTYLTQFRYYENNFPFCSGDGWLLSNDPNWTPYSGSTVGMTFTGTTAATTIDNIVVTYWYPRSDATWVAESGSSACWTLLARNSALDTTRPSGTGTVPMYAYQTRYTCTIKPTVGTYTLPPGFRFRSKCYTNLSSTNGDRWVRRSASVTINGGVETKDTGWFEVVT